jgi:hypothetical protein
LLIAQDGHIIGDITRKRFAVDLLLLAVAVVVLLVPVALQKSGQRAEEVLTRNGHMAPMTPWLGENLQNIRRDQRSNILHYLSCQHLAKVELIVKSITRSEDLPKRVRDVSQKANLIDNTLSPDEKAWTISLAAFEQDAESETRLADIRTYEDSLSLLDKANIEMLRVLGYVYEPPIEKTDDPGQDIIQLSITPYKDDLALVEKCAIPKTSVTPRPNL